MPATALIDLQIGDVGKGRVVDWLVRHGKYQLVARYGGSSNSGHTVVVDGVEYKLHLVPSGIIHGTTCLVCDGVAIDPIAFAEEVRGLEEQGIDCQSLFVSEGAKIILPYHKVIERQEEEGRGEAAIGTTKRGVGPAFADHTRRTGIRVCDLKDPDRFAQLVHDRVGAVNSQYGTELLAGEILEQIRPHLEAIRYRTVRGREVLWDALEREEEILFEGAQGTFLDIDQGTYPYVTSSHPTAGGACLVGIGPQDIRRIIGVTKAYTTRVGAGPFCELTDESGHRLREVGKEYGATTGRPRRCGWFDGPMVRTATRINSVGEIFLTKLDVLTGLDVIKVIRAYQLDGIETTYVPQDTNEYARCIPVYDSLSGWKDPIGEARSWNDLPPEAQKYVERIEGLTGVDVTAISVGPDRDQVFVLD